MLQSWTQQNDDESVCTDVRKTLILFWDCTLTKGRKMKPTQPWIIFCKFSKIWGFFFSLHSSHFSVDSAITLFNNQNQSWSVIVICTLSLRLPFFTEYQKQNKAAAEIQWNFSLVIDFYCCSFYCKAIWVNARFLAIDQHPPIINCDKIVETQLDGVQCNVSHTKSLIL